MNFDTFELCGEKGKVRLTNKEYRLLEYLIANKDVLLSTERIMENVWEFDSAAESLLTMYNKDGKVMETDIADDVTVNADPALINKLLQILFENAYKYSLTKTTIKLTKSGASAVLTVTNDADGVKKGKMEKCFERFYRSDEARAGGVEGSGIGLSVAKEIVEIHKGKITAEGKEDGIFEIKVVL